MFARGPRSASYVFLHSFPLPVFSLAFSFAIEASVSPLATLLWLLTVLLPFSFSLPLRSAYRGLVRGSGGTKELVNGFIWIRSSPYLSYPPLRSIRVSVARFISPPL